MTTQREGARQREKEREQVVPINITDIIIVIAIFQRNISLCYELDCLFSVVELSVCVCVWVGVVCYAIMHRSIGFGTCNPIISP